MSRSTSSRPVPLLCRLLAVGRGLFAVLFIGSAVAAGRHIALGIGVQDSHVEDQSHRDTEFPIHDDHGCLACAVASVLLPAHAATAMLPEPLYARRVSAPPVDQRQASTWLQANHSRSPPSLA